MYFMFLCKSLFNFLMCQNQACFEFCCYLQFVLAHPDSENTLHPLSLPRNEMGEGQVEVKGPT